MSNNYSVKDPKVQDKLENDYAHDTVNAAFANLKNDGSLTDQEFVKLQRRYLAFLISDSLYTDHILDASGIRRRDHLKNFLSKNAGGGGGGNAGGGAQGQAQQQPPSSQAQPQPQPQQSQPQPSGGGGGSGSGGGGSGRGKNK